MVVQLGGSFWPEWRSGSGLITIVCYMVHLSVALVTCLLSGQGQKKSELRRSSAPSRWGENSQRGKRAQSRPTFLKQCSIYL